MSRIAKMTYKNIKKLINYIFWSAVCSLLRAEGFFCSLDVHYGGLGIRKFLFLVIRTLDPDLDSLRMPDQDSMNPKSAALVKSPFSFFLCRECCPCWCPTSATWSAWSSPTRTRPWSRTTAIAPPGSHPGLLDIFWQEVFWGCFLSVFWPGFLISESRFRNFKL